MPYSNLSLGNALNDQVPNPFFGLPPGQGFNVTSPTIPRAQLLRPFPQFGDILMRQVDARREPVPRGDLQVREALTQRLGRPHQLHLQPAEDNQFGEGNFFSRNSTEAQDAYNLDAEYGIGILDVPHKIVFSPIFELPFGEGKRWATSGVGAAILGDWIVSSIIVDRERLPDVASARTRTT